MTMAVCFHCGSIKHGAFNACPQCRTEPDTEDDFAKSLAMTDHYFPPEQLEIIGREIREGRPPIIDPTLLAAMKGDRSLKMVRRVRNHYRKSDPPQPPPPNDAIPPPVLPGGPRDANPEAIVRTSDAVSGESPASPSEPSSGSPALGVGCGLLVLVGVIRLIWGLVREGAK